MREVYQRDEYGENQERDLTMDALQKSRRKVVVAKLIVVISHDKGVIDCKQYEKMSSKFFKSYITRKFLALFQLAGKPHFKLWIQDGDPCQNSHAAKMALKECDADLCYPHQPEVRISIPLRISFIW